MHGVVYCQVTHGAGEEGEGSPQAEKWREEGNGKHLFSKFCHPPHQVMARAWPPAGCPQTQTQCCVSRLGTVSYLKE